MVILGINEDHNATVSLVKDGSVIYAASEERFSRQKNEVGYPFLAVENALKVTGVSPLDIEYVAYSCQTVNPIDLKIKRITRFSIADYVREMHEHWSKVLLEGKPSSFWREIIKEPRFSEAKGNYYNFDFMEDAPEEKWAELFQKERIRVVVDQLGIDPRRVLFINHHKCHAYYAYYGSPVDWKKRTAVVTADGWGDGENGTIWLSESGRLTKIHGTQFCNLARLYRYTTLLLGMKPYEHEYKVMGLAPYAKEYISKKPYEIYKKSLSVAGIDFVWNKNVKDMYFYFREELEGSRFDGIAAGVQQFIEDVLLEWIGNVLNHLETDSLVYSGGLALNVKANKAIAELNNLKSFFVPPSGGDESTAIGAALAVTVEKGFYPAPLAHAYLGYELTDSEVDELVATKEAERKYTVRRNVHNGEIAKLLVENKILARCAGRMEFGARALGNRSIICNPANFENVRRVNECIKFRDFWMPFTPSILDYRARDYLINPKRLEAPYMTMAFGTTPLARDHLKAAIHPADFTARPQIVDKKSNAEYYDLIQSFEKETGIGALLNTSFNLHGEPIVRNAKDAWHTFTNSALDGLMLNRTLILKKENGTP